MRGWSQYNREIGENQVNGKRSQTFHDIKFPIVIELKYHNTSQYNNKKKNPNESENNRKNTKSKLLKFPINARYSIYSWGPTFTLVFYSNRSSKIECEKVL